MGSRREIDFTVTDEGRDQGKVFHITEMSALQAERWAVKALQAAARGGVDIDDSAISSGMQAVAVLGIKALMSANYSDIEPLMAEMLRCVTVKPDPRNPSLTRPLIEDDIEEVRTLLTLRMEVINIHLNFSTPVGSSNSTSATSPRPTDSSNTPMSRAPSEQQFRVARPR